MAGTMTASTICCFVFILRGDLFCLALCYFVLVFFRPFSIAITTLEEVRANLSAFVRLFDLRLLGFVCFFFLFVFGMGWACNCGTHWTFPLPFCDCGTPWTFLLPFFFKLV